MSEKTIQCPKCGNEISITDALSADIKEQFKKEFLALSQKKEEEVSALVAKMAKEKEAISKREADLELQVSARLKTEKLALEQKIKVELGSQTQVEMDDLRIQLKEREDKMKAAQTAEIELRKKTRELEEKAKDVELEVTRKLDEGRKEIETTATKRAEEAARLKDADKNHQLESLKKQIEELKRKSEVGSQQAQGEVLELELETVLKQMFPQDDISPVGKGHKGADVVHKVIGQNGAHLGTILWELKRTNKWGGDWTGKLKDDQRDIAAEVAVLVSAVLPKEVKNFDYFEGIWVSDLSSYAGLAVAMRRQIVEVSHAKASHANREEKAQVLFNYLTGTKFRQKIEAILETYNSLKDDLDAEKRAFARMWKSREERLQAVLITTAEMYGEMQGIAGTPSLPTIKILELPVEEAAADKKGDENK